MASQGQEAFVTLATNDMYALGALVLGHSLKHVGTTKHKAIMITTAVTQGIREQLNSVFDTIKVVDVLDSGDTANLALLNRPDLGVTFTKLQCWRLTQYSKCVFMDADTLVLQNIDELFEREELSAAPDVGWPDCFNSGVFVFRPSEDTYQSLLQYALSVGSFDGGDQGLLNMYFNDWPTKDIAKHLPFTYNVVSTTFYTYRPSIQHFRQKVKVIHFLGEQKPWNHAFNMQSGRVEGASGATGEFLQLWWDMFMHYVQPNIDPNLLGLTGDMATLHLDQYGSYTAEQLADRQRQYAWEQGKIDYLGIDSFQLIQKRIDDVLRTPARTDSATNAASTAATSEPAAGTSAKPAQPKGILMKKILGDEQNPNQSINSGDQQVYY